MMDQQIINDIDYNNIIKLWMKYAQNFFFFELEPEGSHFFY